jgi:hypothetical protein
VIATILNIDQVKNAGDEGGLTTTAGIRGEMLQTSLAVDRLRGRI